MAFCYLNLGCLLSLLKAPHKIFPSQALSPHHLNLKFAQLLCFPCALPLPFLIFFLFSSVLSSATPAIQGPFPLWPSPWLTTTATNRSSWEEILSLSQGDVKTFLY